MKTSKYIAILIIQIFFCTFCFGQREKIDSLLNVLPSLSDTSRIDCLDELCRLHILSSISNNSNHSPDSASFYATLAITEAKRLKYFRGIAMAFQRKAWIERIIFIDLQKAEEFGKESISWYEKTPNKNGLCYSYVETGHVLFGQSLYEESLEFLNKAFECFKKNGDPVMIWPLSLTGQVYREKGEYDKAFDIFRQCFQIAKNTNNEGRITQELLNIGHLYKTIEDYTTSLAYYRQAWNRISAGQRNPFDITLYAEIFSQLHQYDSALYYYNLIDTAKIKESDPRNLKFYLVSMGEYYLMRKEYDKALHNFLRGLVYNQQSNDRNQIKRTLLNIAKTYAAMNNSEAAIQNAREGLELALQTKSKQYIRDAYQVLYTVYDRLQQTDSAYFYYRKYMTQNEVVTNDQLKGKFVAYSYEQKIELLGKEKEIQQARLQKESFLKKVLLSGILALLLFGFIIFRNITLKRRNEKQRLEHELKLQQLESEKTRVELQQQATELEMQALRAQMNPHFIFNSLNSINRFILQNNKAQASGYLTKFSRLVRLILQNSHASLIPLESELESLQLYLELEAVRFDHHFEFKITVENELDTDIIKVPPLIIQPYAENAIWHGLMNKEEKGHLEIKLFQEEDSLCCLITDDGIGRKKAAELKNKSASTHKSMGMQITASRIEMLQQKKQLDAHIKITDLILPDGTAGGTEVLLRIPLTQ